MNIIKYSVKFYNNEFNFYIYTLQKHSKIIRMKYFLNITYITVFTIYAVSPTLSLELEDSKKALLKSSNSRTEFYFSIPPSFNESSQKPIVKVLVSTTYETEVTVDIDAKNYSQTRSTNRNSTVEFLIDRENAEPVSHSGITDKKKEATIYQQSAIHVTSEKSVIIYVIIQNGTVTEG